MTAGTNLGWRIAGVIVFALFVASVMATLIFPIVAGVTNLGMTPGVTKFASLTAWVGYALGDKVQAAHWFVFWTICTSTSSVPMPPRQPTPKR